MICLNTHRGFWVIKHYTLTFPWNFVSVYIVDIHVSINNFLFKCNNLFMKFVFFVFLKHLTGNHLKIRTECMYSNTYFLWLYRSKSLHRDYFVRLSVCPSVHPSVCHALLLLAPSSFCRTLDSDIILTRRIQALMCIIWLRSSYKSTS